MPSALSKFSIRALASGASLAALAGAGCSADDSADAASEGPRILEASLAVVDSAAQTHPDATGEATVTVEDGTGVELTVAGLMPETDYVSHLHDATCRADPPGGEHWAADPDAAASESNEVHLHFITDAEGNGSATVDSGLIADERVKAIVVHLEDPGHMGGGGHGHPASDRVLCGDF